MVFAKIKEKSIPKFFISHLLDIFFYSIRLIKKKNRVGNIAIIVLHRLGDSIFTMEAIRNIVSFHNEKIIIVCFPETLDILKFSFDNVDYLELSHNNFIFADRLATSKAKEKFEKIKPMIIYDLTGNISSASLIFNSSAKRIIGISEVFFKRFIQNFHQLDLAHILQTFI